VIGRPILRAAPALVLFALCCGSLPAAEDYSVEAFIRPESGITDTTTIRLYVQAQGPGNIQMRPPRLVGLTNLRVTGGPSTSYNSVWSNGRFSATSQLIYQLEPEGPGSAEIPALELRIDAKTFRTEPIRFEVRESVGGVPQPAQRSPTATGEPRGEDADVFIRTELGADEVWVGQSVPLVVSLYAADQVSNLGQAREPDLSSFWVEDLAVDPSAESYLARVSGRRYRVYPVRRKVLVPQAPGEFEIDPYVMQLTVRLRSGNRAWNDFFGRSETVTRKTQAVKLKVKALPVDGVPDGFDGAVGRYTLRVAVDRSETTVDEAVSLTATVEGEGFLGAVAPPRFDASPDLKVFDPQISATTKSARGRMESRKTWEWILVPLSPGEIALPELSFSFFDPNLGDYATETVSLKPIPVHRGTGNDAAPLMRGDIQLQRRDLAFIKPLQRELSERSPRAHERRFFLLLLASPLIWVPAVVFVGRHRVRLQLNLGLARSRRARSRAAKRLKQARRHLDSDDSESFHEEVARALVEYVADRFDRSAAGLTYEMADELLASRGLELELRTRFRSCLETCDFARFVPSAGRTERRAEVLHEAGVLTDQLERAL